MNVVGSALAIVAMGVAGLFAGFITGAIFGTIVSASAGPVNVRIAVIVTNVVLDLAAAVGVYFALRAKSVGPPVKAFCVGAGVGVLGALMICSGILFSNS